MGRGDCPQDHRMAPLEDASFVCLDLSLISLELIHVPNCISALHAGRVDDHLFGVTLPNNTLY